MRPINGATDMTDLTTLPKTELNTMLALPLTAPALKKIAKPDLIRMILAAQVEPTPTDPVLDNSSFLTPTLQEVLDGLTDLEKAVLVAHLEAGIACNGAETLDAMRADNMTWSDVAETSKRTGLTKKQVNGVLASLSGKGLLVTDCDPVNGEGAVQQVLDDFGIIVAFELLADGVEATVKQAAPKQKAAPTTRKGTEDRILVHPTEDATKISPIRAGTKRHLMAVAVARGTTLEHLAEITGWSRDVVSAAIYTDFKAAGLGIERKAGKLHLILPEGLKRLPVRDAAVKNETAVAACK